MEQNDASKKCLFLRVWYREKCKLRSFECFPSFKELVHEITTIYPDVKDKLSIPSTRRKKSEDDEKSNRKTYEWRLETNDGEWIETTQDWTTFVSFITSSKVRIGQKLNGHRYALRSGSKPNGHAVKSVDDNTFSGDGTPSLHLSLRLVIQDPSKTPYNPSNPSTPSFEACLKNPLTLIYQRPPPPPYRDYRPPPFAPNPHGHHYRPPPYGHPPPHYGAHYPPPQGPSPLNNGRESGKLYQNGAPEQPPVKKRKLSDSINQNGALSHDPTALNGSTVSPHSQNSVAASTPITTVVPANGSSMTSSVAGSSASNSNGNSNVAVTLLPLPAGPGTISIPSGPPPKELLDANPYGIVHMDGHVWCDACNKWFEVHTFDSHLLS